MSDHEHHHHDDDEEDPRRLAGILFGGLIGGDQDSEAARQARDRHEAEHADMKNRMFSSLRSMNAEQLFMMRHILMACRGSSGGSAFFDGVISAIMVIEKGVDPESGKSAEEMLLTDAVPDSTNQADDQPE